MEPQLTIPFPPDLFEALAQRVAELLRELPVKTLRTKEWRDREGIPYNQLDSGKLLFDRGWG